MPILGAEKLMMRQAKEITFWPMNIKMRKLFMSFLKFQKKTNNNKKTTTH